MSDETKQLETLVKTKETLNKHIDSVEDEIKFQIGSLMLAHGVGSSYSNPAHIIDEGKGIILIVDSCISDFIKALQDTFNPVKIDLVGGIRTNPLGESLAPTLVIILTLISEETDK